VEIPALNRMTVWAQGNAREPPFWSPRFWLPQLCPELALRRSVAGRAAPPTVRLLGRVLV
jgi:hypothetical protein